MKKIHSVLLALMVLVFFTKALYAQKEYDNSIKGVIIDNKTNKPIAGAMFYLNITSYYCKTDANGNFEIKNIIPGSYTPVFQCKNYSTQFTNVYIDKEQKYPLNCNLEPLAADSIAITNASKPSNFESDYAKFDRIIIGNTAYMGSCKAENIDVMNFKWDKDKVIMEGSSNGFLIFTHTKFGYKLHCAINRFYYNTKQLSRGLDYTLYFEEMTPKDNDEKEKWADNRKEAYNGSINHFLWALRNEKYKEEDYEVFTMRSLGNEAFSSDGMDEASNASGQFQMKVHSFSEIHLGKVDDNQIMFSIPAFLKVVHKPRSYSKETSFLQVPSQATMTLDKEGWTDIDMPFTCYGLWGKNGLSNLLPKEYRIKNQ